MKLIGKIAYGALFCIVIPAFLILWGEALGKHIPVKVGRMETAGLLAGFTGLLLLLAGMYDLKKFGKGLPMNAFPPDHYVQQGVYAFFRHPIYVGFCIICIGLSMWAGWAAGLFVVSPLVIMGCAALVMGYEQHALRRRFGRREHYPLFGIPPGNNAPASLGRKFCAAVAIFLPWALAYEALIVLGPGEHAIDTGFGFEKDLPVYETAEIFYALTYPFAGLAPFFASDHKQLRFFVTGAFWIALLGIFFQAALPFCFYPREFAPSGPLGEWIMLERGLDGPAAAFPSFHVAWALFAAACYANYFPSGRYLFYAAGILISLSCIATGVHSLADVTAGALLFVLVHNRSGFWNYMQTACEGLANSWKEWHIGPIRVINHGFFSGLAGLCGTLIIGMFIHNSLALLVLVLSSLTGAALWGQLLDSPTRILRPFGYYGGLIGGIVGALICEWYLQVPAIHTFAASALAAPWVQAIGRLRCLVQGCCHGRIADDGNGIRYNNEHSRVCRIAGLKGQVLHNTQLYSLLGNVFTGLLLFGLWYRGIGLPLMIGLYFILNGLARFVEEAYRGEPQTKKAAGLTVYQWLALFSVCAGAVITTLDPGTSLTFSLRTEPEFAALVIFSGLLCAFALSVDFPGSDKRFSRLSG
ncbi:MAG: prolipoprotein diacylglyceryl transferase family protein [Bacteroidota bacterium]